MYRQAGHTDHIGEFLLGDLSRFKPASSEIVF
jgi:hypothetical protein